MPNGISISPNIIMPTITGSLGLYRIGVNPANHIKQTKSAGLALFLISSWYGSPEKRECPLNFIRVFLQVQFHASLFSG